ncbi:Stp1/IreP family PP2C-type Ser/Thr phosphatase [Feifania hominis]|uniref:Stp1/IreP family PP2C-type Ser/Thr phosphatase n=1 Tax=Feifania hominis TaxID=2763660 RepID=A0A926DFM9_9FIRM|nr:Stp1/IreP family PP2C-type Ser/Thr phosphatase [Feifania hominis]MBC8536981.1 Stp1/IreP family PP2C-type Ser/Thr phosphatase [Feifania hominis]
MRGHGQTDIGLVRTENQDTYLLTTLGENTAFAVVCDGMGGISGGQLASRLAIRTLEQQVRERYYEELSMAEVKELLQFALQSANDAILAEARRDATNHGMGTTAVVALFRENEGVIANIGDSRAYILASGEIAQITEDHSMVQELVQSGKITPEEAAHHPQKNIITKVLGMPGKCEVDYFDIEVYESILVLLCSDGLTNVLDAQKIATIIFGAADLDAAVSGLIEAANAGGGQDNVTAVLFTPGKEQVRADG